MDKETRIWTAATLAVALLTGVPGIVAALSTEKPPAAPERALELTTLTSSDALANMNALGKRLSIRLRIDKEEISNVATQIVSLQNIGSMAIMPGDFVEPLSVSVSPPWKIVAVQNGSEDIPIVWTRKDDTTFVASKTSINPGERLVETVYATDLSVPRQGVTDGPPQLAVKVHARVVNMNGFSSLKPPINDLRLPHGWFAIYIDGFGIPFTIISAGIFLYWYILLLQKARMLATNSFRGASLIVLVAFLSYATAEVLTYYAFGTVWFISNLSIGSPLWAREGINWLVLGIHVSASTYLFRRAKKFRSLVYQH
jgi:hypothetical protein